MDEDEHEVYGGEIPDEADMDADVDMSRSDEDASKVLLSLICHNRFSYEIPSNPNGTPNCGLCVWVAGAGRDEEAAEGDGGGGDCSPWYACQGGEGDGLRPRSDLVPFYPPSLFPGFVD